MRKRRLYIRMAAAIMAVCLAGCSGGRSGSGTASSSTASSSQANARASGYDSDDGIQVGIVLPTMAEPRWLQDQERFQELLDGKDISYEIRFSNADVAKERTNVEALVARGAKVIILCAQDGAAAGEATWAARENGAVIVAYDRLITGTDAIDYYVTFDSVSVGEAQAQYLVDHAPDGMGIPLYLYAGPPTDNNSFLFFEGAWNVLQKKIADGTFVIRNAPEAVACKDKAVLDDAETERILNRISTNWDLDTANKLAHENLASDGAEKGDVLILAPNDGTARAIADAFANDDDVTGYVITGQDAEKASVQYIIDGRQSMTVFKDTRTLAKDAVDMAVAILNGETPSTGAVCNNGCKDVPSRQTEVIAVDKRNVKAVLVDSGYYEASGFTGLE